ncbi:kinetochore protein Spc25-like [Mercenaria mercenaria]|uniref:kinetochore protein Spc25-like n=1 Tax=Mercenaria mercenaria TaxID=6596 RepID=UPI00234E9333|nr:kinetochore protein Spc25-like [Mercenaria mercenaria]
MLVGELDENLKREKLQAACVRKQKEKGVTDKKLEEKCVQLENLKTELEKLYSLSQELHTTKAKCEAENKSVKTDIEQIKTDIDAPTQAKQELQYLNKASDIFSSMLGLTFKKTHGGRIQVIFTHIDEKDPLMAFYFFLQIQGPSRKYVVTDAEPSIDGVDDLVTQLNETNNLRHFMLAMRNKFKDTVEDR